MGGIQSLFQTRIESFNLHTVEDILMTTAASVTIVADDNDDVKHRWTISVKHFSEGRVAMAIGKDCAHMGLLLENDFSVLKTDEQLQFKYCIVHCLPDSKPVLCVSFSNDKLQVLKALGAIVSAKSEDQFICEDESHSFGQSFDIVKTVIGSIEGREFNCQAPRTMSPDESMRSNHTNCKRFVQGLEKLLSFETEEKIKDRFTSFFRKRYPEMDEDWAPTTIWRLSDARGDAPKNDECSLI